MHSMINIVMRVNKAPASGLPGCYNLYGDAQYFRNNYCSFLLTFFSLILSKTAPDDSDLLRTLKNFVLSMDLLSCHSFGI
jgi:hypothetical protein